MNTKLVAPVIFAMLAAPAAADPTPAGSTLLRFDGTTSIPAQVLARMKSAAITPHEISYRPDISRKSAAPLAWKVAFDTVEDPETHFVYLHDLTITLLENHELVCSATTSDLAVGADKVSSPHDKVRSAMILTEMLKCTGPGMYNFSCGGGVSADGTAPQGCGPFEQKGITKPVTGGH